MWGRTAGRVRRGRAGQVLIRAACATVVAAGAIVALPAMSSAAPDAPPVVQTDKGKVRGADVETRRVFQGVPFAAPPVGPLRWRAPQPAAAWQGVRDATAPGSPCPQTAGGLGAEPSTNEDCLYLNITTPKSFSGKLPVMVFIHGGAFVSGSGATYDPAPLVDQGKVAVVTLNYRLGVFGWLGLPQLSAEGGAAKSGLYGLEDQQAALRWVRQNIAAFGGDSRNVTMFGESAGAATSCMNLVSPTAQGLFDRVAAESGCNLMTTSLADGEAQGTAFAGQVGCTSGDVVACLRGKSAADLLNASPSALGAGFTPLYGGEALPDKVSTLLARGSFAKVPLLQGTNHDEGGVFVGTGTFGQVTADTYPQIVRGLWGDAADAVLAEYPTGSYPSPALALATAIGDAEFSCPALQASRLAAPRTRAPVFEYEFNDAAAPSLLPPVKGFPYGVSHGFELPYLFDLGIPLDATQQASAAQLIRYWTRFAATGDPNGAGTPAWPAFGPRKKIQSIETATAHPITADGFGSDHHCGFWEPIIG
ncbi:MAG TPA: carboxylesterase family protein [Amycolatopsis sp.]|nr:carboxylesterase family protein [Amycolatopsis sp.]